MKRSYKTLFEGGSYQEIVDSYLDDAPDDKNAEFWAYVISAHAILGRITEADILFRSKKIKWTQSWDVHVRFFLIIGYCRKSNYDLAQKHLFHLFRIRRNMSASEKVFLYQAFAFYRNLGCRYKQALRTADLAWKLSLLSKFQLGLLLSSDMRGHCLIQIGKVAEGLANLEQAKRLAHKLKNSAYKTATEVSLLSYRAQYGYDSKPIENLKRALQQEKFEDSYSQVNLKLELIRQLTICGHIFEAINLAENVKQKIEELGLSRQRATLSLRLYHLSQFNEQIKLTIAELQDVLSKLDEQRDLFFVSAIMSVISQLTKDQSKKRRYLEEAKVMALKTGSVWSIKMIQRKLLESISHKEDWLGQRWDELQNSGSAHRPITELCERGYWGLIARGLRFNSPSVVEGIWGGRLLWVLPDHIGVSKLSISKTNLKILKLLSKQNVSKDDLVKKIWGYEYDPLRHDTALYSSIHRLRKCLGPASIFLKVNEGSYCFELEVLAALDKMDTPKTLINNDKYLPVVELNQRQLLILTAIKNGECNGTVKELGKRFSVTPLTISRDLSYLLERGYLTRLGLGRATSYILPVSETLTKLV